MGCVAEQDDPALPPLLEPGTDKEAPLEHLALHRPRDDRLCALVEARELLLELIDRGWDGPAFRFPLHPARDGHEVQQLAAPDQIPVEMMSLPEGDGRFVQVLRQKCGGDQATPSDEAGEYGRGRIEQSLSNCRADAICGNDYVCGFGVAIREVQGDASAAV